MGMETSGLEHLLGQGGPLPYKPVLDALIVGEFLLLWQSFLPSLELPLVALGFHTVEKHQTTCPPCHLPAASLECAPVQSKCPWSYVL